MSLSVAYPELWQGSLEGGYRWRPWEKRLYGQGTLSATQYTKMGRVMAPREKFDV